MKKILFILLLLFPITVFAIEYPDVYSDSMIVYDITDDNILYEKNSNDKKSIASLVKIASTITAIENIDDLNKEVEITNEILNTVSWEASKAGLKAGDKVTYKDLLYASIIPSGADATNALAILSSNSVDNFVGKMNELAKKIGLDNTKFVDVTGLDDEGYSTASDLSKLLKYALSNDTFKEVYTTKEYTLSNDLVVKSTLEKYNKTLNKDLSVIKGSKTGFTYAAGYCISVLINEYNHDIIIVSLHAPYDNSYHIIDAINIEEFINKNYNNQVLVSEGTIIKKIPVKFGNIDYINIQSSKNIETFLPNDYDKSLIKTVYDGKESISFLTKENTKIGKISYYYNDKLIFEEDAVTHEKISLNFGSLIKSYFYVPCILIGFIIIFRPKKKRA